MQIWNFFLFTKYTFSSKILFEDTFLLKEGTYFIYCPCLVLLFFQENRFFGSGNVCIFLLFNEIFHAFSQSKTFKPNLLLFKLISIFLFNVSKKVHFDPFVTKFNKCFCLFINLILKISYFWLSIFGIFIYLLFYSLLRLDLGSIHMNCPVCLIL